VQITGQGVGMGKAQRPGTTTWRSVLTVVVTEELDLATVPSFRASLEAALRARPRILAVDLSSCGFAGVDALDALAELSATAREQGTVLVLLGLHPIVRRAVSVLGLERSLLFAEPPAPRVRLAEA
jgi:anti-anti-sigma factor